MRLKIVAAAVFSACCGFSVLNFVLFKNIGNRLNLFHSESGTSLKVTLTEVLSCKTLVSKLLKQLNLIPTKKELLEISTECSLRLVQHLKRLVGKDDSSLNRLRPLADYKNDHREFVAEKHSPAVNSEEMNNKTLGTSFIKSENQTVRDIKLDSTPERARDFNVSKKLPTNTVNPKADFTVWNLRLIMPGTKWCGAGNIATSDDDLGYFEDVDRCCRAHDKCNDTIKSGTSKYNLTNTSSFTALSCRCDDVFYDCLDRINSATSNAVGNTFFNIFSRSCFMLDYPRKCKKHGTFPLWGCQEYEVDTTAEKVYQWKPAKKYFKMPFNISSN